MRTEIGSNFWEFQAEHEQRTHGFWWEDEKYHTEYFKSGRNATKALCRMLSVPQKRVLLPAYTCSTVIEPFTDEGWEIAYYTLNRDLTIDRESLTRAFAEFQPSLVLFHSYFGLDTLKDDHDVIRELQNAGAVIVEDLTQSLFSGHHLPFADYYVTSLRKFYAIPDGGVLIAKKALPAFEKQKSDPQIAQTALSAFQAKAAYFDNMTPEKKELFRGFYQELNQLIADNTAVAEISPLSLEMFNGVDSEQIRRQRQENYLYLESALADVPCVCRTFQIPLGEDTPLYFPIYTEGRRRELQTYLAEHQVYCPVIWPRSPLVTASDETTEYMYANMLCIPVDQRYGTEEMEKVVSLIRNF